jgi:hypothetical protein
MPLAPLLLSDNLLNLRAYPGNALVGDEEPAGFEAFHVADGRRSVGDRWQATTANAQHTLTLTCDRLRTADTVVLDRGHNLGGKEVAIEAADESTFTNPQVIFDAVLPTVTQGGPITGAFGVLTEEGAWAFNFPPRAASYWRLRIPAMGAGLVPQIVGAWLGQSYTPAFLHLPWGEDSNTAQFAETVSEWGWSGRGPVATPNDGTLQIKLSSEFDYELARYHLIEVFGSGRPMWICYDTAQADRMFLALRTKTRIGFEYAPGWWPRQGGIPYQEHAVLRPS